jgi:hypothetical protein
LKDEYLGNRISVSYPKVDKFSSYVLQLTFRILDRKLQHLSRQALPITLEILDTFYDHIITLKACTGQNFDTENVKRGILRTRFPNCIVLVHLNLTIK